ncbi:MAG: TonB-dependent receptor, partial [Candidatus Eremiobacteraeota bacterium]|nr:TonB-dependent receptor [Candidatus Eremiobacteraeota bacterium]
RLGAGSFDTQSVDVETQNATFERLVSRNDYGFIGTTVPSGTRLNADVESTTARVRETHMLGRVRVDGSAGIAVIHLGVPGPVALPFSTPPPNPNLASSYQSSTSRQNTDDRDARLTFSLARHSATTTLDLSATQQSLLFYSSPGDPLACYTAQNTQPCEDLTQEARLQASLRQVVESSAQRVVYGFDLARGVARIDGGGGAVEVNPFAQTAAYVQDTASLGTISAYGGLRGERDGGQGGVVAPSFGAIFPLSRSLRVRTNYAVGFRAPSAVDLYYPGFSNPSLAPERTQNVDVALTSERVLGETSIGYFTLNGDDLIIANPRFTFSKPDGPGNWYLVNAQHASIAGLWLDARTSPLHGLTADLGITDLYRALDLTSAARRLPNRPVFTVNVGLEYTETLRASPLVAFGVIAHSMGARSSLPPSGAIDPTQYAAPFTTVDAYARLRLGRAAILTVRGRNIGNERYAAIASPPFGGYPAPGRFFGVELSTR